MVLDKQFVFIVGAPRSGTTWLQTMMGVHPQVCTSVELTLYSGYIAPWMKLWKQETDAIEAGRFHQGLPFLWSEDEFYGFLREFLRRVYERVLATNPTGTHILDKHPAYTLYIDDINRLLPESLFVHLIRDGRDVAASLVAARADMGFGTATIRESASLWKTYIQAARQASRYEGRYLEIRYEEMLKTPSNVLSSVFRFCGLSDEASLVSKIAEQHEFKKMKADLRMPVEGIHAPAAHYRKGRSGAWKEDLTRMQAYEFERIAGDLLVQLGYAQSGGWAGNRFQEIVLPRLARFSDARQKIVSALRFVRSKSFLQMGR